MIYYNNLILSFFLREKLIYPELKIFEMKSLQRKWNLIEDADRKIEQISFRKKNVFNK